jgi:hypothetical protein
MARAIADKAKSGKLDRDRDPRCRQAHRGLAAPSRGALAKVGCLAALKAPKPARQFHAVECHSAELWRSENIWKHLRERLAFEIEICASVAHGRL